MKKLIVDILAAQIPDLDVQDIEKAIEIPPKPELGDFAFPCFRLAKVMRKAPNMIAADIAAAIDAASFDGKENIDRIEVQGAYLNFFIKKEAYVNSMLQRISGENFGKSDEGNGKTICIDYSSPNVAKNFHVGHLRTTVIGNALYKIFSQLGYKVERINHLGDWGTQFGKLIVAYKNWGSEEAVKEKGIEELMRIYVLFHEKAEENPELNDEARAWFNAMEKGDEEALSIWKWFLDISLEEFKRTYALLGVDFDHYTGESFYRDKTDDIVNDLKNANLLTDRDGAKIVDLSEYGFTAPCLILKKDGSTIYATRDLAAIKYRKNTYDFYKCLYVTGQEQKLHFSQIFKVTELLGNEWAKDSLVHIPYGLVSLGGEKLSTRGGNVIYAEDILKEAIAKIRTTIDEKNPNLQDKDEVARKVGVGAVIFNDLYNQRIKDVSFNWSHILNPEGETGPYVQYTYARCSSILRNAANFEFDLNKIDFSVITDPSSLALIKELYDFPEVVKQAAETYEPHFIARFAVDIAQAFNKFYQDNKVLVDEENVRNARLSLVSLTRKVIRDSMALLGIDCVEEM